MEPLPGFDDWVTRYDADYGPDLDDALKGLACDECDGGDMSISELPRGTRVMVRIECSCGRCVEAWSIDGAVNAWFEDD